MGGLGFVLQIALCNTSLKCPGCVESAEVLAAVLLTLYLHKSLFHLVLSSLSFMRPVIEVSSAREEECTVEKMNGEVYTMFTCPLSVHFHIKSVTHSSAWPVSQNVNAVLEWINHSQWLIIRFSLCCNQQMNEWMNEITTYFKHIKNKLYKNINIRVKCQTLN